MKHGSQMDSDDMAHVPSFIKINRFILNLTRGFRDTQACWQHGAAFIFFLDKESMLRAKPAQGTP
jgi:hypothetical protein